MAIKKRVSKEIKDQKDIEFLIGLTENDITSSLIMETFGDFDSHQRFNPYDIVIIPVGGYGGKLPNGKEKRNTKPFTTTVGRFIFNKAVCGICKSDCRIQAGISLRG